MARIALALLAGLALGGRAIADGTEGVAILDELQAQVSACVAFYSYKRSCGVEGETGRRLDAVSRRSQALAGAIGMAPEEAALRLEMGIAADRSLAGGCEGLARLESRFAPECDPLSAGRE